MTKFRLFSGNQKMVSVYHIRKYGISFLFFFIAVLSSNAQQIQVKGKILDEKTKLSVIGATVKIKGQQGGSVADINGDFSLNVKTLPITLTVTSTGYKNQEVDVYEKEPITIYLVEDVSKLNEVVVVGYGTQRRKELTGSVSSVSKDLLKQKATTLDGILGGAVAGLNVTAISGQPGSGSSIRIRGGNSVYASNEPLYVIDGIIFYRDANTDNTGIGALESSINPLTSVNPGDIESIDVLKDVSATAIFGSRGANGVIIVTTKKGNRGKTVINYMQTIGWSTPSRQLDLMNAKQWANLQRKYFGNKGNISEDVIAQLNAGYNWQDEAIQTGFNQNHELSISGGDEKSTFLLSGNDVNQKGIIINSGFERYNFRINIDRNVSDKLVIGAHTTFGKSTQEGLTTTESVNYNSSPFSSGITNSLTYSLFMPPTVPIYNEDGNYNYKNPWESSHFSLNGKQANPISDLNNSVAETINNSQLANFYARYTIFDGLQAKISTGTDQSSITQNFFAPSYSALGMAEVGIGSIGNKRLEVWQTEATIDYSKRINNIHFINFLGGYTRQNTQINFVTTTATHFTNETLKQNNLADGSKQYPPISGISNSTLNSLISRLNYSLLEKYNLTATFRADNSSRFAKKYRWGYFPSIGFSWNVDNEPFFVKAKNIFSSLKLRLTAGTVGNQEIGNYLYSQFYTAKQYNGSAAYSLENLGNANLKWETTAQYNAGVDIGFFNNRINLVSDVYYKKTYDLLLETPVKPWEGVTDQLKNIGNVTNRGVEASIIADIVKKKNIQWSVSANFARNINKITDMGESTTLIFGNNESQLLRVGESLGSFYGLVFDGIVQTDDNIASLPKVKGATPEPGDIKFANISKDDKIDLNDRTILGNIQPHFTYGLSTTLKYKQFDLFASFQGSQGNKVANWLRRNLETAGDSYNVSAILLNAWTPENPSREIPKVTNTRPFTYIDSRYVEDASYFRLKNITLGYKISFTKYELRFFISGQNLFTLTGYKGYDPEVASGIDMGAYPTSKTFSGGFGLTFN